MILESCVEALCAYAFIWNSVHVGYILKCIWLGHRDRTADTGTIYSSQTLLGIIHEHKVEHF